MLTPTEPDVVQPHCQNPEFVVTAVQDVAYREVANLAQAKLPQETASNGFGQMFGLHFYATGLTLLVDSMIFAGDIVSLGMLLPLAIGTAGVLGYIVYMIQRKYYGDDHEGALIKALIVGLLTAIPVPLGPLITIPSGIIGAVNMVRRKMK